MMGIFNYLKGVFGQDGAAQYRAWLTNSQPIFTSFGSDIYLSDAVNNAIDRVATEISKIDVKSVVEYGDTLKVQNDDITRLFRSKPNPLQTTSDFLSSVEWLRRKNCNAFIYPQFVTVTAANGMSFRRYVAMYPLNPSSVRIGVNEDNQVWEIKMDFGDGTSYTLPYEWLIHMKWRRGKNLVTGGGNDHGMVNDYDVKRTIDALDKTIQGLPKSIEASLQVKGVYHAKTIADANKLAKMRDEFESHIFAAKGGMMATDLGGEFTPVNISPPDIPDTAMRFLKAVIEEKYGVSAAILSGDYNGEQHSAFYQTEIEDFIVQFEQASTACLFTPREQDVGHKVKCFYHKVNYLSMQNKIDIANLGTNVGNMTLNQINDMLGIEPFEGGDKRVQSLNYVDVAIANQYQMGNQNADATKAGDTVNDVVAEETVLDVAGKGLNGAQTQSLLATMQQYSEGKLTEGQAINIIAIALGVTKAQAKEIIEGLQDE